MIPLLALEAIPTKKLAYIAVALVALHILGVYPMDVLLSDVMTVTGHIVDAIVDWLTTIIQDAVKGAIPGAL